MRSEFSWLQPPDLDILRKCRLPGAKRADNSATAWIWIAPQGSRLKLEAGSSGMPREAHIVAPPGSEQPAESCLRDSCLQGQGCVRHCQPEALTPSRRIVERTSRSAQALGPQGALEAGTHWFLLSVTAANARLLYVFDSEGRARTDRGSWK